MEPISIVVGLCMFVNNELREHRIQESMSQCLKHKREALRNVNDKTHIDYRCGEVKVELETNVDGSKSIKRIIEDK